MSSSENDDDDAFCDIVRVKAPHNTAHASLIVSPAHGAVETTIASAKNSARNQKKRLRWMPTAMVSSVNKDGRAAQVAPSFLTDPNNMMDIMLVRQLLADKPFEAGRGKTTAAWETSAHYLSLSAYPAGNSIFPSGINARQLKDRFGELMAFTRKLDREVPLRSGCDDEDLTGELQLGLEELLQLSMFATNTATTNTALAASRAQEDREKAEQLRKASLGELSVEELRQLRAGKRRKTTPNCVSPRMTPAASSNIDHMAAWVDRMEARSEKKEIHRQEKLALKAKELEMKDAESARAFKLKEIEREAEKERAYKELEMKEAESVRAFKLQEQQL